MGTTPGGWTRAGRQGIGQLTGGGRLAGIDAELPRLWDDAPGSRRALAGALFERIEVLGLRRMRIEATPTAIASGPVEAFSRALGGYGRGERISADTFQLIIWIPRDASSRPRLFRSA